MKNGFVLATLTALSIAGLLSAQSAPMPAPQRKEIKIVAPKPPVPPKAPKAPKAPKPPKAGDKIEIIERADGKSNSFFMGKDGTFMVSPGNGDGAFEIKLDDVTSNGGAATIELQCEDGACEEGACDEGAGECEIECDEDAPALFGMLGGEGGHGLSGMLKHGLQNVEITLNGEKLNLHDLGGCLESAVKGHMNGKMNIAVKLGDHAVKVPLDHCPIVGLLGGHGGHGQSSGDCCDDKGACPHAAPKHGDSCGGQSCCPCEGQKKNVEVRVRKVEGHKATPAPAKVRARKVEKHEMPSELPQLKAGSKVRQLVIAAPNALSPKNTNGFAVATIAPHGGGGIATVCPTAPADKACEGACDAACEKACEEPCETCPKAATPAPAQIKKSMRLAAPKAAPKATDIFVESGGKNRSFLLATPVEGKIVETTPAPEFRGMIAAPAKADGMGALKQELAKMRKELDKLRAELDRLRAKTQEAK